MIPVWLFVSVALADLTVDEPVIAGVETMVTVRDDDGRPQVGVTVTAVHRPGLGGESHQALGLTDSLGRVRWTPERGGTAEIRAGDHSRPVRVRWRGAPVSIVAHVILLVVAGLLAIAYGSRRGS